MIRIPLKIFRHKSYSFYNLSVAEYKYLAYCLAHNIAVDSDISNTFKLINKNRNYRPSEINQIKSKLTGILYEVDNFKNTAPRKGSGLTYVRAKSETLLWITEHATTVTDCRLIFKLLENYSSKAYKEWVVTNTKMYKNSTVIRMIRININDFLEELYPNKGKTIDDHKHDRTTAGKEKIYQNYHAKQNKNKLLDSLEKLKNIQYQDGSCFIKSFTLNNNILTIELDKKGTQNDKK